MIETGLKDRVAIVTGANNPYGIGAGIAKAFVEQGAKVLLHYFRVKTKTSSRKSVSEDISSPGEEFYYRQIAKSADEVLQRIRDLGGKAHAQEAELSDPAAVPHLFDETEKTLGPVQTGWITPQLEQELFPSIPLARVGTPEDVANVVIFLSSEQAGWVTGQKFFVGGGHGV